MFNEDRIKDMLEASDYDSIDNVSPFFGELLDSVCGFPKTRETISAITNYVDKAIYLCKRHKSFEWYDASIKHLQARVQTFRKHTKAAFEMYHFTRMLSQTWYAQVDLCEAAKYAGRIKNLLTRLYEAFHEQFRAMYALGL